MLREARAAGACRLIAINREWEWLPNADALYAADAKFWRMYGRRIIAEFAGERWTASDQTPVEFGARFIRIRGLPGLSRDPACVHGGQNGGYQAINLAYHLGARTIILVGYDMQRGPKGEAHHFGDHPRELGQAANPAAWVANFDRLAADLSREGVRVTNCTPRSALTQFPTGDLAATLRGAARLPAAA